MVSSNSAREARGRRRRTCAQSAFRLRHMSMSVGLVGVMTTTIIPQDTLKGRCGVCEYRAICGGSRSRAYALTGDPLAEEPCCAYVPRPALTEART